MDPRSSNYQLARTPSGRDKNKAQATRDALGGSPPAMRSPTMSSHTTSYHLVVCGAKNHINDRFMFADFMAFCKYLSDKNVGGTFLSCFPVDAHFGELSGRGKTSIKFGKHPDNEDCLLEYTRFQHVRREQWWEDVGPYDLKARVLGWISDTAQKAEAGDVVNIIFESHSGKNNGVVLGAHHLNALDFSDTLKAFKHGVQVNAINGACHSGLFVDVIAASNQSGRYIAAACGFEQVAAGMPRSTSNRCRGPRYEQAWVQSFARLRAFGDSPLTDPPARSVQEHEAYIRDNMHRSFPPVKSKLGQKSAWVANPSEILEKAIEELIVTDKIDVLYDPEKTHRRRRIEWPTENRQFFPLYNTARRISSSMNPTPEKFQEAVALLESEAEKCDQDSGLPCDIGVFDFWLDKKPDYISQRLLTLYYRGRIQSALLDTFIMLVQRGFLNINSLRNPIEMWQYSDTVNDISQVLAVFNGIAKESDPELGVNPPYEMWESESTLEAVDWLATMIARDCTDLPQAFAAIEASRFLGDVSFEALCKHRARFPYLITITHDQNERVAAEMPSTNAYFGFWLPHGLANETDSEIEIYHGIARALKRFDDIERVFKSWFEIPDDKILRADQQAKYFDENPHKCLDPLKAYLENDAAYRKASQSKTIQALAGGFQHLRASS